MFLSACAIPGKASPSYLLDQPEFGEFVPPGAANDGLPTQFRYSEARSCWVSGTEKAQCEARNGNAA